MTSANAKPRAGELAGAPRESSKDMSEVNWHRLLAEEHADLKAERDALAAQNGELVEALALAKALRPKLLKDFGYVPEYVLDFCNNARAVLAKVRP